MSARRHLSYFFICSLLLTVSPLVFADVTNFRALVDVDNNEATGCTVAGMAGVDHVFTTEVDLTDTTANVLRTYRQVCSGSTLGPDVEVDHDPYPAGYTPASGELLIETRLPFSAFDRTDLPDLRVGFTATRGTTALAALQHPDGTPLMFPIHSSRRRSVRSGEGERVIVRDGVLSDWAGLPPFLDGIAANGTTAMRFLKIYAFANTTEDMLYLAFDVNVSDAPFANDDLYTRAQGSGLTVGPAQGVLANDGDPNDLPLTATPVTPASHGSVTLNPDGSFTYSPNTPSSLQADAFEYRASNGTKQSNVARVQINVHNGAVQPFVANDDTYPTDEDTPLNVPTPGVLGNDTGPGDAPLAATLVTPPAHGTVTLNADGGFTYTPSLNFFGTDTFVYSVGPNGASDTATVTLTVMAVNDPPVVKAATFSIPENSPNGTTVGTVHVTDPDTTDTHTWAITSGNGTGAFAINASTGRITVANSSVLNFETNPTFSLHVRATDSGTPPLSDTATITINLTDVNDQPVANADSYAATEDTPLNVPAPGVLGNDTDEDTGAVLTASIVGNASHGNVSLNPDGSFLYTPNANYNSNVSGNDSFTYNVSDGSLTSNTATVTISIAPVNDPPSFTSGGDVTGSEDTAFSAPWATAISTGPSDEAGQSVTFNVTANDTPALFSVQPAISSTGVLTFTPATNATGTATITVELQDNGGGADTSSPATFQITINPINDPPTFTSGGDVTVLEDSGAYSAAWATGISPGPGASESGQTLTFVVTNNSNPSLFAAGPAIDASGTLTFTPTADANGSASITVELQDDGGGTNTSTPVTFAINVTPVNDEPSFTSGGDVTVNEDSGAYSAAWATAIDPGATNESSQTMSFVVTNNTNSSLFASGPAVDASGTLTFTPATNQNGTAAITIEMHDDGGTTDGGDDTSSAVTFNINVTDVNDAPSFTSGGNVSVVEDSGAYSAAWATAISKGPADENAQNLTFVVSNNTDPSLFSVAPAVSSTGVLSFTPAANAYGTATITIHLADDGGTANGGDDTSADVTFDIEVRAQNDAPTFSNAGNVTVLEDSGAYSASWASAIDAGPNEGSQTMTFVVTANTNTALFAAGPSVSPTGVLTFTPATNANGSADITLHLADDGGTADGGDDTSADVTFTIFVTAVNDEPTFTSGGNVTVVEDSGAYSAAWATAISKGPADENTQNLTFVISNNTDPSLFSVAPSVSSTGVLSFTPAANAFGTATITVYLTDDGGTANGGDDTSASVNFDIIIDNQNDEPSFTSGGDVTVLEDSGAYSAAWATGINPGTNEGSQNVSFVVTGNTNSALFAAAPSVSSTGVLSFTPTADANGSSLITLHIVDDGGTANGGDDTGVDVSFTIFVTAVNDEPTFTSGGDVTVVEDSGAYSAAWATAISKGPADENTQNLTFVISNNTDPSLFSVAPSVSSTGVLSFTPAANAFGTATITIHLADDGGTANGGDDTSADVTFDIIITNQNDEPSFTSGGDVTVLEDSGAYSAAWATGINPGTNEGSQNVSFVVTGNSNSALFAAGPSVSSTGVLSFTPTADANGSSLITLHIVDDGGTANGGDDTGVDVSFTIFVTAVNDEPTFTSGGDVTVVEDSGAYSAAWATAISKGPSDENTQNLTFVISGNTNSGLFSSGPSISSTGVLSFTPAANAFGTATITVYLTDDGGTANGGDDTSASVNFDIIITNQNDEPSFTSGGDVTVLEDSGAYSAAWATGINPGPNEGSQNVSFVVTGNSNSALFAAGPSVSPTGVLSFTPTADANGSSLITLHIVDDGGTADGGDDTGVDVSFTIFVTAVNDEPTFTSGGDVTVLEDSGAYSAAWATAISKGPSDENTQNLTFVISGNTNSGLFSSGPSISSTGVLSFTPAANAFGTATITVYLTDDGGTANGGDDTSASVNFDIIITNQNDEPSFTSGGDVTVLEDSGAYSAAWATGIDPGTNEGSQNVSFVVTGNTNAALFAAAPSVSPTGVLSFTPAADANGSSLITLHIVDDGGTANGGDDTGQDVSFTIFVTAVNDEPSFTSGGDVTVLEDSGAYSAAWATGINRGASNESSQNVSFTVTGNTNASLFAVAPAVSSTGVLSFTPALSANGSSLITLHIADDGGTANGGDDTGADVSFTISVTAVNDEPSFSSGGDVTVLEDSGAYSAAWATGINPGANEGSQNVSFVITGNSNSGLFSAGPSVSSTGVLSFTPAANANGSSLITLHIVDDGGTANGGDDTGQDVSFTIFVTAVNDAPTFTATSPAFVLTNAGAQSVTVVTAISAGPTADETGSQTVTLAITNNTNPSLFSAGPSLANDGTLTYTPATNAVGTADLTIQATDSGGTANGGVDTSGTQVITIAVERGPSVTSSNPAAAATIPRSQDLTFNFDESVSVESDAFAITCNADPTLLPYTITTSTGTAIVVNPTSDLPAGTCTVVLDKDKVHDTDTYDPPDGLSANYSVTFSTNTPPVADDDADFARGNVTLVATPAEGVLVGDTDADGHTLTVTSAGSPSVVVNGVNAATTTQGGSIVFNTDGSYTYYPQAGDQNITDTVDYTVSDGFGGTDVGTLSITVGPRYIFVDDDNAGNGTGTQADPYKTLALKDASPYIAANEIVIVKSGSYTTGTTLKSGEQLLGQGVSSNITATQGTRTFTILTAGAAPVINRTSGDAITLNSGNTVRGFTIQTTTSGRGVVGSAFGALTMNESSIATNGGAALDLTNGAATITLTSTSSAGSSAQGVNLNAVTGTVALGSGSITTPAGVGFNVVGGTATITYAGNITGSGSTAVTIGTHTTNNITLSGTITGSANGGISVSGQTSGTVAFTGAQNLSTGASTAVSLTGNTGGTIAFSGTGLAITTTTGAAFTANTGGTVSVTGTTNSITVSGAGTGLTLNGVTVASGNNVTFNTMSMNAASTTGVSLTSLSGSGSVVINGGTISSVTGLSMTTMGTVGTSLSGVTFSGNTTAITGSSFGTLTVGTTTLTNSANQFLNLSTGTLNGTFTSIGGTVNANAVAVSLTSVGGNFTVSGGTITKGGSNNKVMLVAGGAATINWQGNLTQGQNADLVNVTSTNTGTITWSGTLSATAGTGLVFNDADGTYTFSGSTTLNGGSAGISISNGSAGSFGFGASTSVTGTATGIPFSYDSSSGSVTYSGNLTQTAAARLVSITAQSAGTITFQTGTLAGNTSSTGILLNNADGTVNFNGTTTLSGAATITVNNGSSGTIAFASSTTVTNPSGTNFSFDSSNANVTYSGNLTQTGAQRIVSVTTQTGGTITFQTGTLAANTASTGILLDNADGTVNFNGTNTLNGGDAGVDIQNGSAATVSFASTSSISNPSGIAFRINGSAPTSMTYAGSITASSNRAVEVAYTSPATGACGANTFSGAISATGAATGILIDRCSSGSVAFTNASKSISTSTGAAFTVSNNGATVTSTNGGLVINSTSGAGIAVSGGGAFGVSGTGNTITTTTGTSLSVSSATITGGPLTFQSINTNGAANGVVLSSTGSNGLTITGTGAGTCNQLVAPSCTGGTIQNTTGTGISMTSASNLSLTGVLIKDAGVHGISMTTGSGLTLSNCQLRSNGDGDNEHDVALTNIGGTLTVGTTYFYGAGEDLININNTATNLTVSITGAGNTFEYPNPKDTSFSNSAIIVSPKSSSDITLTVTNATFKNIPTNSLNFGGDSTATATHDVTFSNNTLSVDAALNVMCSVSTECRAGGVTVSSIGTDKINFIAASNGFTRVSGSGVIEVGANGTSTMFAKVSSNTISNSLGDGIALGNNSRSRTIAEFLNNSLSNIGGDGFQIASGETDTTIGTGNEADLDLTMTGNSVATHTTNAAIQFVGGIGIFNFGDSDQVLCAKLTNNSISGTPSGFFDIYMEKNQGGVGGTGKYYHSTNNGLATTGSDVQGDNPSTTLANIYANMTNTNVQCATTGL